MKGFFLTLAILTICFSLMWTLNGVDEPFQLSEIIDYLEKMPATENTIVTAFNTMKDMFDQYSETVEEIQKLTDNIAQEGESGYGFMQVFEKIFTAIVFIVESIYVVLILAIYALPLVLSVLYDFMYYARIIVYVCFGLPL